MFLFYQVLAHLQGPHTGKVSLMVEQRNVIRQCAFLHRWEGGPWSDCSQTCNGKQTRRVFCEGTQPDGTKIEVDTGICKAEASVIALKSITNRSCGEECKTYSWSAREWGNCNSECGPGIQRRTVACHKATISSTVTVDDSECINAVGRRPVRTRDCMRVCQCVASAWAPCSVSCGCGQQTRTSICATSGAQATVAFSHCEFDPTQSCGPQEEEQQQCEEHCYEWDPQPWGACSATCGPGNEERHISCMREGCDGVNRVEDNECGSRLIVSKPNTTRRCHSHCEYDFGMWSPCSATCGISTQTRRVECLKTDVTGKQAVINLGYCVNDSTIPEQLPHSTRDCVMDVCATYSWLVEPWGLCNEVCAPGKQARVVYCRKLTATSDDSTADIDCEEMGPKPATERNCDFDCQYVTSRWGDCSESCGRGMQTRSVICRQTDEQKRTRTVMLQNCEEEASLGFRPRATRPCYTEPCAVVEGTCRHIYCHGLHGALSAIFVVF